MTKVIFIFESKEITILCNLKEKMKDIFMKFSSKTQIDISKISFIYNGNKINENMELQQIINEEDKKRNIMNIFVNKIDKDINENIIKSKEVICPECKESILINIKDYKINLNKCKNGHNINNILFKDYEKTQNIDISKINNNNYKCEKHNRDYHKYCNDCNINLCVKCVKLYLLKIFLMMMMILK